MHSTGYMSSRSQITARPRTDSGTSVDSTWCGTSSASRSNHHSDIRVRISPLSGMVVSRTKSNAEMRSLATMSSRPSASSYRSRTLSECRCVAPSMAGAEGGMGREYRAAPGRRSVPDLERTGSRRLRLGHGDVAHRGVRRTVPAPVDHGVDGVVVAFEMSGHGPVRLVAPPAGHPVPLGLLHGVPPERDALHPAGHLHRHGTGHVSQPRREPG